MPTTVPLHTAQAPPLLSLEAPKQRTSTAKSTAYASNDFSAVLAAETHALKRKDEYPQPEESQGLDRVQTFQESKPPVMEEVKPESPARGEPESPDDTDQKEEGESEDTTEHDEKQQDLNPEAQAQVNVSATPVILVTAQTEQYQPASSEPAAAENQATMQTIAAAASTPDEGIILDSKGQLVQFKADLASQAVDAQKGDSAEAVQAGTAAPAEAGQTATTTTEALPQAARSNYAAISASSRNESAELTTSAEQGQVTTTQTAKATQPATTSTTVSSSLSMAEAPVLDELDKHLGHATDQLSPRVESGKSTIEGPPASQYTAAMGVKGAEVSSASLEPARLAEAHNQGLTRQISQGVETLVRTGQTSIQIHLQPQDLGRIDLRLTTNGEGTWVTISTEKAATGMLLERQLDELKQTLVNAGVHLNDLSLNTGTGQQGQAQSALRWQQTKTAHAQSKDSDIVDANQAVNLSLIGRTNGSTGVDYRV